MPIYNRVILTGKVAKSAQRRYRPDGSPVIQFPLELNHQEDPVAGEGKSLIDIVALGKLAEFELNLLQPGQRLQVEGKLKQRRWQTPEGRNRTSIEVIATDLRRLGEEDGTKVLQQRGGDDE